MIGAVGPIAIGTGQANRYRQVSGESLSARVRLVNAANDPPQVEPGLMRWLQFNGRVIGGSALGQFVQPASMCRTWARSARGPKPTADETSIPVAGRLGINVKQRSMFRVITFNANGIRAAARKGFFRWMEAQQPDVVCLQETKAQEHQIPPEALALPDFTYAFVDAQKKGYSGVAIYSRRKPLEIERGLGFPDIDSEGRFIRMEFGDLSIASLYVPSGTSGPARQAVKYSFLDRFIATLAGLKNRGVATILCGDYNIAHRDIDVFDPKSCLHTTGFLPDERRWFDDVIDRVGWVDAFRTVNSDSKQFSWWSNWPNAFERNLGWRIDYQLITPDLSDHVRAATIYRDERFSDHAPVTIDYDL